VANQSVNRVEVIDSHTGGEPTRVVIGGGPELGAGPLAERVEVFRSKHDAFRAGVVNEPRGHDVLVGALLTPPHAPECDAGVIFFNNIGALGMCGHGAIGVIETLFYLGKLPAGHCRLDTPVGSVDAMRHDDGRVSIQNVPSYRFRKQVAIDVPGLGPIHGDVAYGGNWFFLTEAHGQRLELDNRARLTEVAGQIRQALSAAGVTGKDGAEIDHIELLGPASDATVADSQNFVLCPGGAYDRSPCGTGTSAKLACLIAEGKLAPGGTWRQESITGSVFTATAELAGNRILPTITGRAFVMAEATLLFDPEDVSLG